MTRSLYLILATTLTLCGMAAATSGGAVKTNPEAAALGTLIVCCVLAWIARSK